MTAPSTIQAVELSDLRTRDGLRLATAFQQATPEVARVVLTHGMGEFSGRYPHVMSHLASRGISCAAYDLRGHGRSEGKRGGLRRYRDFLEDLDAVFHRFDQPDTPTFLYGHSLGGQITANYLASFSPSAAGAILASPWLKLAFRPPWWRLALAVAAARILPGITQTSPRIELNLSRDTAWLESLKHPTLTHRRISAGMFFALQRGAAAARHASGNIRLPLLLMHGEADKVTSAASSRAFFDALPSADKQFKPWPEMRHETHNEIGREDVIATVANWILQRSQPPAS